MLALVGTVMSRSPSGNVLLRDGDGVLGTHKVGGQCLHGLLGLHLMVDFRTLAVAQAA